MVRGWLGVGVQPVTPELADALDLETQEGALVSEVTPGSPADGRGARARRRDRPLRWTAPVQRMRELPRAVAAMPPGTKVELEVVRDGKHETKTVKIAELAEETARATTPTQGDDRGSTAFGFDISDVPAELRQQLGLGREEGALITRVYPGGPAEESGLRAGDVIVEVDRSPVAGGLDAEQKLREAGKTTLLVVRRDEASFFAAVKRRED